MGSVLSSTNGTQSPTNGTFACMDIRCLVFTPCLLLALLACTEEPPNTHGASINTDSQRLATTPKGATSFMPTDTLVRPPVVFPEHLAEVPLLTVENLSISVVQGAAPVLRVQNGQRALQPRALQPQAFTDPRFLFAEIGLRRDSLWSVRTYGRVALSDSTELLVLELQGRLFGVEPNCIAVGLPINPATGRTRRPVVLAARYAQPRFQHSSASWLTQLVPGGPPELLLRARGHSTGAEGADVRDEHLTAAWDAATGSFRRISVPNEAALLAAHPLGY
jgi:hypothetical protein